MLETLLAFGVGECLHYIARAGVVGKKQVVKSERRTYPLLRNPVAIPLMVRWIARFTSTSLSPARWRCNRATCKWLSGSMYGVRVSRLRANAGLSCSNVAVSYT